MATLKELVNEKLGALQEPEPEPQSLFGKGS